MNEQEKANKVNHAQLVENIADIVCQAILNSPLDPAAAEMYYRQVLGDVAASLACILPIDYAERAAGTSAPTTTAERAAGTSAPTTTAERASVERGRDRAPSDPQSEEDWRFPWITWQTFATKADVTEMGRNNLNGKVYEIRIFKRKDAEKDTEFFCNVNGFTVLEGNFTGSAWMLRKMLTSALQSLVKEKSRRTRQHNRAKKRHAAALAPARELAATVARQTDDDDLAQQIENA